LAKWRAKPNKTIEHNSRKRTNHLHASIEQERRTIVADVLSQRIRITVPIDPVKVSKSEIKGEEVVKKKK
jgi:hypothetical protein